jgi:hypothetical protein
MVALHERTVPSDAPTIRHAEPRDVPPRMALLDLIGGPLLILSFVLKLCDVYELGSPMDGLLTLPEAAWELALGIYAAWKGFRLDSQIARDQMAMAD